MEDMVRNLRRKYESFKRGELDALVVKDEALLILREARGKGNPKILEEVEDMLLDLEFSLEENRCKCQRKCSERQTSSRLK